MVERKGDAVLCRCRVCGHSYLSRSQAAYSHWYAFLKTPLVVAVCAVIGSDTAAYEDQAEAVFTQVEAGLRSGRSVTISFEGIGDCSTRFLGGVIGRLYRTFPIQTLSDRLTCTGTDPVQTAMIERTIDKTLNPEKYRQLLNETLANE